MTRDELIKVLDRTLEHRATIEHMFGNSGYLRGDIREYNAAVEGQALGLKKILDAFDELRAEVDRLQKGRTE